MRRQGRRLPAVVRLRRADGNQRTRPVGLRFGQHQLELAHFIPTKGNSGQIVAFNPQA